MSGYGEFHDQQVKHLEMIQAVVSRLGNNAFFIKGWAITLTAAFVGFAVNQDRWELAAASVAPTLLFWVLDTSFLRNERLFRALFDRVKNGDEDPFFMGATSKGFVERLRAAAEGSDSRLDVSSRFRTFWRQTLLVFYGAVISSAAAVAAILGCS